MSTGNILHGYFSHIRDTAAHIFPVEKGASIDSNGFNNVIDKLNSFDVIKAAKVNTKLCSILMFYIIIYAIHFGEIAL